MSSRADRSEAWRSRDKTEPTRPLLNCYAPLRRSRSARRERHLGIYRRSFCKSAGKSLALPSFSGVQDSLRHGCSIARDGLRPAARTAPSQERASYPRSKPVWSGALFTARAGRLLVADPELVEGQPNGKSDIRT